MKIAPVIKTSAKLTFIYNKATEKTNKMTMGRTLKVQPICMKS